MTEIAMGLTGGLGLLIMVVAGLVLVLYLVPIPLWIAAWLLIAMMIASMVAGFWPEYGRLAGAVFLFLFTALLAAWFARLDSDPPPLAAMDLYLLGLSLFLAAALVRNA
jgi:hypothetical protein